MNLQNHMVQTGRRLFSWRSYFPTILAGVVVYALAHFTFILGSHRMDNLWDLLCLAISLSGLGVRAATVAFVPKGTSGRNTRRIKADRLNTTGMYSIVRHPLYLGNFLIVLGEVLFFHNVYLTAFIAAAFWLYYERIMLAEEDFLRQTYGGAFQAWAERTPALLPAISRWESPDLTFCVRTLLRREHSTLLGIALVFSAFEVIGHWVVEGGFEAEIWWIGLLAFALTLSLTVRVFKRFTRLLHVEGR